MFKKRVLFFVFLMVIVLNGCMGNSSGKEEENISKKRVRGYETVYFRGTANKWEKSEMTLIDNGIYRIAANFDGSGNPDRFKVDVSGNWSEAYPAADYKISEGIGSYLILFNSETKGIECEKLPILKIENSSQMVTKNSTEFKLPETGEYINEEGITESVTLTWDKSLDTTVAGVKEYTAEYKGIKVILTVTVKDPAVKESSYTEIYFRGTANNWEKTAMVLVDDYLWKTFITFDGKTANEGFKIDVSGNWKTAYPAANYKITDGAGEYTITFNEKTKEVKAVKGVTDKVTLDSYSLTIEKDDAEFYLPKYGKVVKSDGVVERVWLTKWSPKLDKTKQGTTTYYAIASNGAVAKFDLTVKKYTFYPNGVYFRGTPNSWEKTNMESAGYYIRQTVQEFKGNANDRFKVDVSGNWSYAYPYKDFMITEGAGKYLITFNEMTKAVTAVKIEENEMIEVESGKAIVNMCGFSFKMGVDYNYFISKYEVTQGEFMDIMGYNPSYSVGNSGNNPVENVTYYDAVIYCNKLSEIEGFTPYYNITDISYDSENNHKRVINAKVSRNSIADGYRVPEMEEWLYAAAGGVKSEGKLYAGSDDLSDVAWYSENAKEDISYLFNPDTTYYSNGGTHKVGKKLPNELGIYDMSGNVAELLEGTNSSEMTFAGGSWTKDINRCECSATETVTFGGDIYLKNYGKDIGFRIVRKK